MRLLVGLGNPGREYEGNRHNIGFMALDEIVRRHGFSPWRRRFQGQTADGRIGEEKVVALKPETFMNESGRSVGEALRFFKLEPAQVIVLYDEIELAPGKVRVKQGGGHAGHNGLRSLDAHIGKDYWRVRLGVGRPERKEDVRNWVLRDFAKADRDWLEKLLDAVAGEMPLLVAGDDGSFMSRVAHLTQPPKPPKPPKAPKAEQPEAGADSEKTGKETDGL